MYCLVNKNGILAQPPHGLRVCCCLSWSRYSFSGISSFFHCRGNQCGILVVTIPCFSLGLQLMCIFLKNMVVFCMFFQVNINRLCAYDFFNSVSFLKFIHVMHIAMQFIQFYFSHILLYGYRYSIVLRCGLFPNLGQYEQCCCNCQCVCVFGCVLTSESPRWQGQVHLQVQQKECPTVLSSQQKVGFFIVLSLPVAEFLLSGQYIICVVFHLQFLDYCMIEHIFV